MLIDTHCHLNFEQFACDRDEVIKRAKQAGVGIIINVGACVATSIQSQQLASEYKGIFASVGIHPHYAQAVTKEDITKLVSLTKRDKVIAIGEVGLDYYNRDNSRQKISISARSQQRDILEKFIQLSHKTKLPLIFHCRDAKEDMTAAVRNVGGRYLRGVMHCFCQDRKFLDVCLERGLYISFTGNITYKKAEDLRELIRYMPLERLLLETDAPYLAPQVVRGKRNEPAYIEFIAKEIARIKNIAFEQVAQVTTANAQTLFNI